MVARGELGLAQVKLHIAENCRHTLGVKPTRPHDPLDIAKQGKGHARLHALAVNRCG
jgi:hypothetical protein